MTPEISVVVPVCNSRLYLRPAVESLLAENDVALEVIVVDDGSTDMCVETVRDLPVRILERENGGPAAAQNLGFESARGRFLTVLDSDDLLERGGLCVRLEYLLTNPDCPAVGGLPAGVIGPSGRALPEFPHVGAPGYAVPKELSLDFYREGGAFPVGTWLFLFRKEFVDRLGPFDESLRIGQDCEYLFRALKESPIPIIERGVVRRRVHGSNLSVERGPGGKLRLKDATVAAVKGVHERYEVPIGEWIPWEYGY